MIKERDLFPGKKTLNFIQFGEWVLLKHGQLRCIMVFEILQR